MVALFLVQFKYFLIKKCNLKIYYFNFIVAANKIGGDQNCKEVTTPKALFRRETRHLSWIKIFLFLNKDRDTISKLA